MHVHGCACVWWGFCPWLDQRPGGSGRLGLLLGRQEGLRGHCALQGVLVGRLMAGAFVSDRELAQGGMMGTPCELGAFLFGVAAPWTTSVA